MKLIRVTDFEHADDITTICLNLFVLSSYLYIIQTKYLNFSFQRNLRCERHIM